MKTGRTKRTRMRTSRKKENEWEDEEDKDGEEKNEGIKEEDPHFSFPSRHRFSPSCLFLVIFRWTIFISFSSLLLLLSCVVYIHRQPINIPTDSLLVPLLSVVTQFVPIHSYLNLPFSANLRPNHHWFLSFLQNNLYLYMRGFCKGGENRWSKSILEKGDNRSLGGQE